MLKQPQTQCMISAIFEQPTLSFMVHMQLQEINHVCFILGRLCSAWVLTLHSGKAVHSHSQLNQAQMCGSLYMIYLSGIMECNRYIIYHTIFITTVDARHLKWGEPEQVVEYGK